jgi:ABC-type glycerol-3-phosphate transport system permease component
MYEHHSRPLMPRPQFFRRLAKSIATAGGVIVVSLIIGMMGYHHFETMNWVDAFANAAMILSGMGPLTPLATNSGKIFAGCYALYSGLALVTTIGIIFAPVLHRFLHKFHLEDERS